VSYTRCLMGAFNLNIRRMNVDDDINTMNTECSENDINAEAEADARTETSVDPIEELKDKLAVTHDRLLRTAAELDNFRKRARRDVEDAVNRGRADVLVEIIPVMDSVDLALSSITDETQIGIAEGLQMIKRQFLSAVERFGVKPIESRGKAFDPNHHEAVLQVHSNVHPVGSVVDEMRKGYLIGEKLLRPAMVTVSRGPLLEVPPSEEGEPADTTDEMNLVESQDKQ
jgi:molecular chaperone GrpE